MKNKTSTLSLVGLMLALAATTGCQPEPEQNQQQATEFAETQKSTSDGFGETFYRVPSPEDLFDLVSSGNVQYTAEVLNPISNSDKYIDMLSKEFNFGVYSADLAYTSAFQRYQESYDYIEAVRKLSTDVGVASVFDEALLARVHNIFQNSASLMSVTTSTYSRFVRQLEHSDRGRTLAIISAGGWVESLYIVVNLVGPYKANNTNIQRIADQKLTFENLIDYLMQHKDDPAVEKLIADLYNIKIVYDQLEEEKVESHKTPNADSQFVVGGGSRIVIDEAQYSALKEAIVAVRNKLTQN